MSEVVLSIFPINNFDSNVELLRLDGKTRLRHPDNGEFQNVKEKFSEHRGALEVAFLNVNYVVETKIRLDETGEAWEKLPHVDNILLALRLLKVGDVNISFAFLVDSKDRIFGIKVPSISDIFFRNPYFLKKEEATSFVKLWKKLLKVKDEKPHLRFPLTQFNKAFEKRASGMDGDEIVDCMVALESLVFYGENKSIEPAGKVMGVAIGMLLGNNEKERNKIKKTLTKAYEVRNAKVHGNMDKLKKYQKDIGRLSVEVEDYLRLTLRRFVEE